MSGTSWLRILIRLIGAIAVATLIWFGGPLLPFRETHPLEEAFPRLAAILAVFALVASAGLYRWRRRRKGVERIARGMSVDESDAPLLTARMKEALSALRNRGGLAKYLYDLPWYVVIGPPGSGKSTALVNSGLKFPLTAGIAPRAVAGVGGARGCDWWFASDAVFLETADRHTTQDLDAKPNQNSWAAFLDLLKRNRSRQPINGVLVAFSLEDLLILPPAEVAAHAAAIKAQLLELRQRLKVDFPVYALFTKADLVVGFMEFFADLDEAGRTQVWGETFQTTDKSKSMLAEAPAAFAALVERLNKRVTRRLAEEKDATNRILLFGFPAQMAALRQPVTNFLSKIFDPAHYQSNAALRGFYFSSATQQGAPIDQLLGALAKGLAAEAVGAPAYSGQRKSFFLTDLIRKVLIGEAGWVSTQRGQRVVKKVALASMLVAAPLLIGAWWINYARNSDRIAHIEEAAAKYSVLAGDVGRSDTVSDRDLSKILPELHSLRFLPGGFGDNSNSLSGGFGLNQSARLKSAAETAYGVGLERLLRPRLIYRLEERLEANGNDPAALFEALKVYLMLGGLARADRQLLINWMERDWSENLYPGPRNSEGRKELEQHLLAMLDLETGRGSSVPLNGPLVEKIQAKLASENVADRAFRTLAARAKASSRPDWSAGKAGGAEALVVFDQSIGAIQVPYFLTKPGFEQDFIMAAPGIVDEISRDRWVLGAAGEQPAIAEQYDKLEENLVDVYAKAFIDAWREAIDKLKLRRLITERPSYPLLAAASSSASPIGRLLQSIRDETLLTDAEQALATDAAGDEPPVASITGAGGQTPAQMIDAALAPFHRLVEGDAGRRPIDLVISQLNEIRANLSRLASNGSSADQLESQIAASVAKLKTDASSLPQPFNHMMEETADDATREIVDLVVARTADKLRNSVTMACRERISSRFPFNRSAARDVSLEDFARMFGPKGLIDQFVSENILPASGAEWKWRDGSQLAKKLAPTALADFQLAAEIREAFFGADSAVPGFSYAVTPPALRASRLEIDATVINGGAKAITVQWPGPAAIHRTALRLRSSKAPAIERQGVWSIYRMLDAGRVNGDGTLATFSIGGRDLQYRFNASATSPSATLKPLDLIQLRKFHCPNGA
ncbi:MAG: type VI secretion system membrane subunit TssM [Methylocella sp.]